MNEEYLNSLYTWITSQDETFKAAHTPESFAQKISADKAYAAKMYEWIVGKDASFSQALPVDAFMKRISSTGEPVKKKMVWYRGWEMVHWSLKGLIDLLWLRTIRVLRLVRL